MIEKLKEVLDFDEPFRRGNHAITAQDLRTIIRQLEQADRMREALKKLLEYAEEAAEEIDIEDRVRSIEELEADGVLDSRIIEARAALSQAKGDA